MKTNRNASNFILFLFLIGICFSYCFESNKKKSPNEFTIDAYKMTVNRNVLNWNCEGVFQDTFCFPKNWLVAKSPNVYFACLLDSFSNTRYFAVLKHSLINDKPIETYLKNELQILKNDTTQTGKEYSVKKLLFKSGLTLYYCEFFQEINKVGYKTLSMIFLKEGSLYDIVLKIEKDSSTVYQDIFKNIVFNTKIKSVTVFDPSDIIEKFEIIDISKL